MGGRTVFSFVTLLFVLLYHIAIVKCATATVSFDFTTPVGTSTSALFGVGDNSNLVPTDDGTFLMGEMADMNLQTVKVVDTVQNTVWADQVNQVWNKTAVQNYFTTIRSTYAAAGKKMPMFLISIKIWPTWIFDGTTPLPTNLYANYSAWCADLVHLVNIELGLGVTHWQPWNNLDNTYINAMSSLYDLYNQTSFAMKQVDPTIKVGPGFGTVSAANSIALIQSSTYVDFVNAHLYFTSDLTTLPTSQIFSSTSFEDRLTSYVTTVQASYPNMNIFLDEYGLYYLSTADDTRITTNIAAVWFAKVMIFLATHNVYAATAFTLRSNYFGVVAMNNVERPSASIFKWANDYLVGTIMYSTSNTLDILAVQNGPVSSVLLVNIGSDDVTFYLTDIVGWNATFLKNTVNATGQYEDEIDPEWLNGANSSQLYTIPAYSVWHLYYNASAPPVTLPVSSSSTTGTYYPSMTKIQLQFTLANPSSFTNADFSTTMATALSLGTSQIVVVSVDSARKRISSSVNIIFEILASNDATVSKAIQTLKTILQTPQNYLSAEGYTPIASSFQILETVYADSDEVSLRKFSPSLSGGLGVLVGIGFLVAFFAGAMLFIYWDIFVKKYGAFYCGVFISGAMMSVAAAATLLPNPTDGLCLLFPWLLGAAFTLTYGCLFIKTWILYRIWRTSMKLQRAHITALTVVKWVGVALAVEVVVLIIWTVVDPPKVKLVKMVNNTLQPQCKPDHPTFWIIFLCLKGVWLLFGVVMSLITRHVAKEYADFTAIFYAIYNIGILFVIAIPLALTLQTVPNGVMIIEVIVITIAFSLTTVILFFDTWQKILFPLKDDFPLPTRSNTTTVSRSNSNSNSASSSSSK